MITQKPIQNTAVWLGQFLPSLVLPSGGTLSSGTVVIWARHLGVGTNKPVGRNNKVRISTTKETITACDGSTQIVA